MGLDGDTWQWLKIKELGLRRFWSMLPVTRVPFLYRFFEPYPHLCAGTLDVATLRALFVWEMAFRFRRLHLSDGEPSQP